MNLLFSESCEIPRTIVTQFLLIIEIIEFKMILKFKIIRPVDVVITTPELKVNISSKQSLT